MSFVSFTSSSMTEEFFFAPERHRHQPSHVKRGTSCGDSSDQPNQPAERYEGCGRRFPKYLVFGPETAERNDSADCQPACKKRPVGVGHVLLQPAHSSHVLLVVHSVNDAARSEEHQSFEERMCHDMAYSDGQRHKA